MFVDFVFAVTCTNISSIGSVFMYQENVSFSRTYSCVALSLNVKVTPESEIIQNELEIKNREKQQFSLASRVSSDCGDW